MGSMFCSKNSSNTQSTANLNINSISSDNNEISQVNFNDDEPLKISPSSIKEKNDQQRK